MPGRGFIFFATSVKQDDIPGFKSDLTEGVKKNNYREG
jgi:hypothetical protein